MSRSAVARCSDDEPRDEHGRWSGGGDSGSGGTADKPSGAAPTKLAQELEKMEPRYREPEPPDAKADAGRDAGDRKKQDAEDIVDQTLDPEDGESMEDFMDRCIDDLSGDVDEDVAQEACRMKWEETGDDADGMNYYADPGYRADAKKRYALDTPKEIRRSWYRISLQSGEYTEAQLSRIKARAVSAWKARIHKDGPPTDAATIALLREAPPPARTSLMFKIRSTEGSGMEFVLSDATPDRFGDVVEPAGWVVDSFGKNPIALFAHDSTFPIGRWADITIGKNDLRARLMLAPKGTSDRIDEIRNLIDADILRATSVGFRPIESEPIKGDALGWRYTRQELVECSIVAVPANPNALAVAKSLGVSAPTLRMVFGERADKNIVQRQTISSRGKHADKAVRENEEAMPPASMPKPIERRGDKPMLLSQRIQDAEKHLLALQDNLDRHIEAIDDQNPTEEQMVLTEDATTKIETAKRHLTNLKAIEAKSAAGAEEVGKKFLGATAFQRPPLGITFREKKIEPLDFMVRAAVVRCKSKSEGMDIDVARQKIYGDDEATRVMCDLMLKATSAPALTSVAGWAQELVHTIWAQFMDVLLPMSVFPQLMAKGLALSFGGSGRIIIPTRSLTPSISGSFVGEGQPIPVRQGAFSSQTLVPKKMAVITTWTREMGEFSIPAIEGLLRQAIIEDTAISLDTVLLDANPATAIRPSGLRNYQAATTASAVTPGFVNFVADFKALYGALLTLTAGNVRTPVLILNPIQVLAISLMQPPSAAAPLFPFIEMVDGGRVLRAALIASSTVTAGQAIMVDAADFTTAGEEGPRMEISDQATLHMEDTTPLDITAPGTPPTVAAPVKSMWQTDSLALRLVMRMNWVMRRPVVSWMSGVSW